MVDETELETAVKKTETENSGKNIETERNMKNLSILYSSKMALPTVLLTKPPNHNVYIKNIFSCCACHRNQKIFCVTLCTSDDCVL